MPRKKKEDAKQEVGAANPNECAECRKKGVKVIMTNRGKDSLECPKCHCWKQKAIQETKEDRIARLRRELEQAEKP